jgi:hypothetical protein
LLELASQTNHLTLPVHGYPAEDAKKIEQKYPHLKKELELFIEPMMRVDQNTSF